jgi:hypothetical protein
MREYQHLMKCVSTVNNIYHNRNEEMTRNYKTMNYTSYQQQNLRNDVNNMPKELLLDDNLW